MTISNLLLVSSYQGFDDSFKEETIDIGIGSKTVASACHSSDCERFWQLCDEYTLSVIEPTPIGSEIDIVKSLDIPQDTRKQNLYTTLEHVEDIRADSCGSKRPRDSTVEAETSAKKAKKVKKTSRQYFRSYQAYHWATQYEAMIRFRNENNHCFVPHNFPENPNLSSWVKRQRNQYKLMIAGRHHTLTPERLSKLEEHGFVWDSHKAIWQERYSDLCRYKERHGHVNVPNKYPADSQLGIWVKCQRRQYRLFRQGKPSSITMERIDQLDRIGFAWKAPMGCPRLQNV